jgi:hypothetical protein
MYDTGDRVTGRHFVFITQSYRGIYEKCRPERKQNLHFRNIVYQLKKKKVSVSQNNFPDSMPAY